MPHIILDCPRPLAGMVDLDAVLDRLQAAIAREPSVAAADVKSRVHLVDHWRSGEGRAGESVVHARVLLTRPRSEAQRTAIAALALDGLRTAFARPPVPLQLCVELTAVPDGHYVKTSAAVSSPLNKVSAP